MRLYQKKEG